MTVSDHELGEERPALGATGCPFFTSREGNEFARVRPLLLRGARNVSSGPRRPAVAPRINVMTTDVKCRRQQRDGGVPAASRPQPQSRFARPWYAMHILVNSRRWEREWARVGSVWSRDLL